MPILSFQHLMETGVLGNVGGNTEGAEGGAVEAKNALVTCSGEKISKAAARRARKEALKEQQDAQDDSKGRHTTGKDIFTNFMQYNLPLPEIVICDAAMLPWRYVDSGWVDCIVTDPPYGVRAGMKKQGRKASSREFQIQDRATYIPSKVSYGDEELTENLLSLAATALRDNGRIVYLAPVDLADFLGVDRAAENGTGVKPETLRDVCMPKKGRPYKDPRLCIPETSRDPKLLDEARYSDFLPVHPDLELMGASLQILSGGLGRLLVVFR